MNLRRVLGLSACFLWAAAVGVNAQSPKQNPGKKGGAVPPRKSVAPATPPRRPAEERSAPPAPNRSLEERIAAVLPTEEEDGWLEIKWRTNIAAARAEAARENKPVFLWVMNGNPIGCG
jgi:hypothetical protein